MAGEVNLSIDDKIIKPIIEAQIEAAIVRELGQAKDLIPQMVNSVLNMKVDSGGKISTYSSDNQTTFIEYTCRAAIQKAAKAAVVKWVEEHHSMLEKEIAKALNLQKGPMAQVFVAGITEALQASWRFSMDVNIRNLT